MSFQPMLPASGYAGWVFLNRTLEAQKETFAESPATARDAEYFTENISEVRTARDLVSDYRLLKVALGAFGLEDDIDNKYFIQKVLEEGTTAENAFANNLTDSRYKAFSEAFGFGEGEQRRTSIIGFAEGIVSDYEDRQFEVAVGEQNEDYRLALDTQRALSAIAADDLSDDGMWYSVMGSTPLRTVFETAFGLPDTFSSLDLDDQLEVFRDKAAKMFGDGEVSQFTDTDRLDELVKTFLLRSELDDVPTGLSSSSIALTLLGGAGLG
ncbi:DUF1217 domain-containing protein [Tropicimonas marinistellae]|uniref:DUF1217 domain-containing protein n=1 Tax=Tropicimonas marinistellae TaxID=1739787 RepID=UPI00082EF719|nr:DUF1217 domain-containing protein [Tropicimonas marinistellae]